MHPHLSGQAHRTTTKRPQLTRCLKTLRDGDTLIIWKLDRLGRSLRDLITTLDDLRDWGIHIHSLTENIASETRTGRIMCQMIALLAELERSLIIERTRAGMQAARALGVRPGPKPTLSSQQIEHARKLHKQHESATPLRAFSDAAALLFTGRLLNRNF